MQPTTSKTRSSQTCELQAAPCTPSPERSRFVRIVDGGLDAKDRDLVVDLHPVAGQSVLDPPAFGAGFGVGDDLGFQGGVELAAQEAEHVGRRHVQAGVADQVRPDLLQGSPSAEHDVGGDLGLVDGTVVAAKACLFERLQQRVDPPGEGIEQPGPGPVGEALAQVGRRVEVIYAQQGVFVAEVADPGGVKLAGEPLSPVHPDLDGVRQP